MKRRLRPNEIAAHFDEQWGYLRKSCDAYDRGDESEAKRIAGTLRLLLHDTKSQRSLLGQLGLLDVLFFDTAENVNPQNALPTFGLVMVRMHEGRARFVPPPAKDGPPRPIWLIPFQYWWAKRVISIPGQFDLTRRDLVTLMADQDGGVHVDPSIDERYYRLTRENALGFTLAVGDDAVPIAHLEGASVRQIAQEVLTSLVKPRRGIPADLPDSVIKPVTQIVRNAKTGETVHRELPVRRMCMCNSGLEYRECHARGGRNEGKRVAPRAT